jgi:hypothetical protein
MFLLNIGKEAYFMPVTLHTLGRLLIYRLIRNGELEAIDLIAGDGEIPQKGHYHIKRSGLNRYLETKKVKPLPNQSSRPRPHGSSPKVKNHL